MQDSFTDACEYIAQQLLSSGEYKAFSVPRVFVITNLRRIFSNVFILSL